MLPNIRLRLATRHLGYLERTKNVQSLCKVTHGLADGALSIAFHAELRTTEKAEELIMACSVKKIARPHLAARSLAKARRLSFFAQYHDCY